MTHRLMLTTAFALGTLSLAGCKPAPDNTTATAGATATGTAPGTSTAPASFAAGNWEMTAEMTNVEAVGAPKEDQAEIAQLRAMLTGKPQTKTVCVSQTDVNGGLESLFVTDAGKCTLKSKDIANGRIEATYSCATQPGKTGDISTAGRYTADTMSTSTLIATPGPKAGTALNMTATTKGRRLGDC